MRAPRAPAPPSSSILQRLEVVALGALCAALFATSLFAFSRHNTFPYYCHHDEPTKVRQVLTRDFNFNHPQLLLLTTDLVRRSQGVNDGYQRVVMLGRWVSATFAATSVVLLALLGWTAFGLLGAWCIGLAVAVCPVLGVTAHFLKEDTALMTGLSVWLLALMLWHERPRTGRLVGLGLACGLAASGKYLGALCVPFSIALVLGTRTPTQEISSQRRLALLLLPAISVFVAINFSIFDQPEAFTEGLSGGATLAVQGRQHADSPNLLVIDELGRLAWQVLVLAGVGVLALTIGFRRCFAGWALLAMGLVFTGMLLLSPLGVPDRYLLVPAVSVHALAGLGIVLLAEIAGRNVRFRRAAKLAGAAAAIGLVWVAAPTYRSMAIEAFDQADARGELIQWANATLDRDATLAASERVRLPGVHGLEPADSAIQFERALVALNSANELDADALDEMRQRGITHIILRRDEFRSYQERSRAGPGGTPSTTDPPLSEPEVVWRTPERFEGKNRWLRLDLRVLRL